MSVSAHIDILLSSEKQATATVIVPLLFQAGWNSERPGEFEVRPMGDIDEFDWEFSTMSKQGFLDFASEKERAGEAVGVSLVFAATGTGGTFTFAGRRLSVSILNNRRIDPTTDLTDFQWYVHRIVPALNTGGAWIDSVETSHIR